MSIAGVIASVPAARAGEPPPPGRARTIDDLAQHARLNEHLWQVFTLATSKRQVYPLVHAQLAALITEMRNSPADAVHRELCVLACDLFQLAGEISFDGNEYDHAAHCYGLAASVGREARSYGQWACALTRQAFVHIYGEQYSQATDVLDTADSVLGLSGPASPGGWLRFDGTRLGEERGTCYLTLGQASLAESELNSALASTVSLRRRGSILVDPGNARRPAQGHQPGWPSSTTVSTGFREAWIAGVLKHFPGQPKTGYIAPWDDIPDWERQAAAAVCEQVRQFIDISGGTTAKLTREQKGRFVATCWIAQIYKHIEHEHGNGQKRLSPMEPSP